MANETSKSTQVRSSLGQIKKYFTGRGLDIGAGDDILKTPYGSVDPFDWAQGDAQYLAPITDATYDFVYSSHCLEHMRDIDESLKNWIRVIKPGGYLFITVPDWVLYEHRTWPSMFNGDHKHAFGVNPDDNAILRSDMRYWIVQKDVKAILEKYGMTFIEGVLEDDGFDFSLPTHIDQTNGLPALCQIRIIGQKA